MVISFMSVNDTKKCGDIFSQDVEAIVNPVNCIGVMGKGLALEFKKRFPENYKIYHDACTMNKYHPGDAVIHPVPVDAKQNNLKYIINFATKNKWWNKSKIEYIETGLKNLVNVIIENDIKSIAIPALGCGLGGLPWLEVKLLICKYFSMEYNKDFNPTIKVIVFNPK